MSGRRIHVNAAVEGLLDAAVAARVLAHAGLALGHVQGLRGKNWLDRNLRGFNAAAGRQPWLVLRDLDHDEPCAGALVARLLPRRAAGLCLRVCVRAADAWLLADHTGLAGFFQISPDLVCVDPETLPRPKAHIVELARRSRSANLRADVVPRAGTSADAGPAYAQRLREFVQSRWSPARAARRSPSVARCLRALRAVRAGAAR